MNQQLLKEQFCPAKSIHSAIREKLNPILLSAILFVYLLSATANVYGKKPAWVDKRPNPRDYYIGIGLANYTGNAEEDLRRATENAFNDLAAALKVQIESRTTDIAREEAGISTEIMDYRVETTVSAVLEGVEIVDRWSENAKKEGYWVYVRLSKIMLAEKERLKRENAKNLAYDNYKRGVSSISTGSVGTGLRAFIEGYVNLIEYSNEPIEVIHNGKPIVLSSTLFQSIGDLLSGLKLTPVNGSSLSGRFQKSLDVPLKLRLTLDSAGKAVPASGVPVKFEPVNISMRLDTAANTDASGFAESRVYRLIDQKDKQHVTASIDLNGILNSVVSDTILAKIIMNSMSRFNVPSATFEIDVSNVIISDFYDIDDNRQGAMLNLIRESIRDGLTSELSVAFSDDVDKSNFTLSVQVFTEPSPPNQFGISITYANYTFTMKDNKSGDVIYSKVLEKVKGAGLDEKSSRKKALMKGVNIFKTEIAAEIIALLDKI
ncbi:MAG: LPP20 family lipoprotein [Candidatus Marinimicrobia bacterium]|nr:LPP20 family lipoprotein [Candidatus Neomarinimicrobiota bacterium]